MEDNAVQRFVQLVRQRGYRVTAQRIAIARIVFENIKDHPSFTEILEKAKREVPGVSASTVYNTLQLLEQLGLIQSFSVEGVTRFDQPHPHVNVVCLDTGRVVDLEGNHELLGKIEERIGGKIRNIVVYAYCGGGGSSGPG